MHECKKFAVVAIVILMMSCVSPPQTTQTVIKPEFKVVSIFIVQADIVVTEFEAVINIDNPNDFPMELASITYELFGNGRFWTGGNVRDVMQIPANSSKEARFVFSMNFIDMSRTLLDDVIAMRQVNYRFRGNAEVRPVIPGGYVLNAAFDCSGYSNVKRVID
jgi:LEA14-like dessication related protein